MPEPVESPQVLVVEDDVIVQKLVCRYLEDSGYSVTTADTGPQGLRFARTRRFDLIILDIGLPDMDGLRVCQTLRGDKQEAPILILTGRRDKLSHEQAVQVGANDFLVKPFKAHQLMEAIEELNINASSGKKKKRFGLF